MTLYSLVDAEVFSRTLMEEKYANISDLLHGDRSMAGASPSPLALWDANEVERKSEWEHVGALGSCMVVSMELPEGYDRPVREAFMDVRCVPPLRCPS